MKPQAEFTPGILTLEYMLLASTLTSSIFMNIGIFYNKSLTTKTDDRTVWFLETIYTNVYLSISKYVHFMHAWKVYLIIYSISLK